MPARTAHSQTFVPLKLPDSLSFCGERVPIDIPDVRERLEDIFYLRISNDEQIYLLLRRSRRYFPLYERLLKEAGAPDDLKYLSAAESALRIDAYSNADAGGLWQFIPSAAKAWGLRVDKFVDERFHPEKATRAAIRVLQQFHEEFGSWSVAAAAYNTGETNLYRARKDQYQTNYYDLFLNKETRTYVLQIAVLKEIFEHPEKYGYRLRDADYFPPYDDSSRTIDIQGPIADIGAMAKAMGTNYKIIKLMNYWIMKNELPEGNWSMMIPQRLSVDSTLRVRLSKPDSVRTTSEGVSFLHRVAQGETLTLIAAQYGVTIGGLLQWNTLPTDDLSVGQSLKVIVPLPGKIRHTVRPGDNLIKISEFYRVTVPRIKEWNKLTSDVLKAGDTLTIRIGEN